MPDLTHLTITSLLLSGLSLTVTMMIIVFIISEKIKNAGIVDVFWGLGFSLVAGLYFLLLHISGQGWLPRQILILVMVAVWSLRLAWFLWLRFKRQYPEEDGRYASYRKAWGDKASLGMFGAFQLQAFLLASLTLPFAVAMLDDRSSLAASEIVGVIIWLIAVVGESIADHQLESFKKDPANQGKVCQVGLWSHSRHPNYFFEWLAWMAYLIFVLASPGGIYCLYCPVVMYFFLTQVTGVKATEEQSLRTRGDAYRKYQKTTSAFFPWFKKGADDAAI